MAQGQVQSLVDALLVASLDVVIAQHEAALLTEPEVGGNQPIGSLFLPAH